ncbi:ferredoxin [Paramagnetospirillum marisnigri]|uniref:Ferredoxin n=1 Tax=Paramagnetospirillum marisnigri TaxID=1285242 RepID=A0A178M7R4_9PROT|nr:4Fe-4S binding protein [Paramagnetospirillum marisnigri]OAN44782.1 ferredoxin [Paramagnetospirillum marisnigri]
MALKIIADECTSCGACEFECPNAAISSKGGTYVIKASACTECDGDATKCQAVCPVEGCIVQG